MAGRWDRTRPRDTLALAVIAIPLAFASPDWISSYIELPKVFILRVSTGLMAVLLIARWSLKPPSVASWTPGRLAASVRRDPTTLVVLAVVLFGAVYTLSTLLSVSPRLSLWGSPPERDGYSLYNMACYFLLFGVVTTHLKSPDQLRRLLVAIVVVGVTAALIGILQNYEIGPYSLGHPWDVRVQSTFGNPIFFGAFLVMTIPVSVALAMTPGPKGLGRGRALLWSAIVGLQLFALMLTVSRGPWVGLFAAIGVFSFATLSESGHRRLAKTFLVICVLLVLGAVSFMALSRLGGFESGRFAGVSSVSPRLSNIWSELTSDHPESRLSMWRVSARLIVDRPWFPFEDLSLPLLRLFFGYGPETYRYVFPLEAPPGEQYALPSYAHNHFVHEATELGVLGVGAYAGVFAAVLVATAILVRRGYLQCLQSRKMVLAAVLAALLGRSVEQMFGIPRIGDLTLFWVLLGVFVALPAVSRPDPQKRPHKRRQTFATAINTSPWKPLLGLLLVLALIPVVWTKTVSYLVADVHATSAREHLPSDYAEALSLLERANGLAPDVLAYYWYHSELLDSLLSQAAEPERRAELAERIYADRWSAVQANPLSQEAGIKLAAAGMTLARLGYPGKADETIRRYRDLVTMAPGYGQLYNVLATAYVDFGRPSEALPVLDRLLSTSQPSSVHARGHYLRGVAYKELGKTSEATASLKRSLELYGSSEIKEDARRLLMSFRRAARQVDRRRCCPG